MSEFDPKLWPSISVEDWADTRDTFQLFTQIVGKVRMSNEPLRNHWWNVPLYVNPRGLTTTLMPHPTGPSFEIDFDLVDHRLEVTTVAGGRGSFNIEPMTVADFYAKTMALLDELGVRTTIWPVPVELPDAIPFEDDRMHSSYDADAVHQFWLSLVQIDRVMKIFDERFVGKSSPVHLFWGAIDLALTRFSGRTAPKHPGGAPNCGPHVMWEAYSHEVSSCGYWPGAPGEEGTFYAYAYPEPAGYRETEITVEGAEWNNELGEFILPYEVVRRADDSDRVLLDFFQQTYEAAATTAKWDRDSLERSWWPND